MREAGVSKVPQGMESGLIFGHLDKFIHEAIEFIDIKGAGYFMNSEIFIQDKLGMDVHRLCGVSPG